MFVLCNAALTCSNMFVYWIEDIKLMCDCPKLQTIRAYDLSKFMDQKVIDAVRTDQWVEKRAEY